MYVKRFIIDKCDIERSRAGKTSKISREGGKYFPKFPGHKYLESFSEKSSSIINGRVRLFEEIN